ncbi:MULTISPECIES: beta/gamma crystallin-related protein [unclassified Bradyrhizobium]|uniref:beta/gamma crystallin-related protein n=1 Tax=unclassified Bradyrhizobium TaxID=2631580 RepID=UPI0027D75F89|nr:hypothetical protein TM233_11830 [Bradyrhizobium sp. TM233]GMO98257.1 hypothetical protein TM239_17860 [Bradyrhizobium sp. TM239]
MDRLVPVHALNAANGSMVDLQSPLIKSMPKKGKVFEQGDTTSAKFEMAEGCIRLPEIVIYEHANWGGASAQTSLNWNYVGDWWNDKISSIVVLGGHWRLFEHTNFGGQSWDFAPGQYAQIPNDIVSSFKLISFC